MNIVFLCVYMPSVQNRQFIRLYYFELSLFPVSILMLPMEAFVEGFRCVPSPFRSGRARCHKFAVFIGRRQSLHEDSMGGIPGPSLFHLERQHRRLPCYNAVRGQTDLLE